ncbi:E3 ubiquitin-protein ligase TRIM32-like [Pomacea canaliculata]|uniref:E3 ubiquitin-protein ligase TRIM32-like n=1 Tax=Pomacea canaliculata TaxID=400727 RepID=UPI000D730129|nr:E3 ubiquitin-protein ligase TRIM32-like [Pomacea canaliculata]
MDATQEPLLTNCDKPECPVCLSPFTEPKIMFCGHVICRVCLITWVEARGVSAGCPLCRHRILVMQPPDLQRMEHLAEYVADSLPTHHIIKATARGTVDITPDTCLRCENLICSSSSSPHPNCTGPRDAQNADQREAEALDIVNDLSHKLQMMVEWTDYFQDFLLDIVTALRGLVVVNDRVSQLKDQSLQFLTFFQGKITECRTVLLTHQHLLEIMRDSRQVVATILMRKPMQERIKTILTQCERLHLSFSRGCRDLRSPWITET